MVPDTDMSKPGTIIDRPFLLSLLSQRGSVLLETSRKDSSNNSNLLFHTPVKEYSAYELADIPSVFKNIESDIAEGLWAAGFVGYECGYHFENVLQFTGSNGPVPLLWFGLFNEPLRIDPSLLDGITHHQKPEVTSPALEITDSEYYASIKKLKEYIVAGDSYQINFTDRFTFSFNGDVRDLYFTLRRQQHVPFGAFINAGSYQILSFSPELFFRRNGSSITAKPMKGTAGRGRTLSEDLEKADQLRTDEKNRSENLMIVDLLRNDIGRICEPGSVRVSDMYAVETFDTILQMTSTINGTLLKETGYYDIFRSLFPCGSVTGAPKIRTMQIIRELERHDRGVYCGAIGYIAPKAEAVFNVAIRTIELTKDGGTMGVGSGIVFDSDPMQELEECKLKAAFLTRTPVSFDLLETMMWKNEFKFLPRHLERLERSAEYFFFTFDRQKILEALKAAERKFEPGQAYRIRLLLTRQGLPMVEANPLKPSSAKQIVKIAPERTDSSNPFFFHKTTNRELYNRYWKKAEDEQIIDYLFLNERDEVTEGAVTNLFIEKEGNLYTPPPECGLLPGIYRGEVLKTNPRSSEKTIKKEDLYNADAIFVCNAVKGWVKVTLSE